MKKLNQLISKVLLVFLYASLCILEAIERKINTKTTTYETR